ncbi:hypothetical protein P7K49_013321 [Saguinus oedipus]|uniref:Uncharacterized protein n=1 Tax=Saguinus oedipus TaxID=9490 RepID=A0ABQ9VG52_SAGOE|nr:hypothetical protein P7K49_013321 [Saguinus oedipus]
MPGIQPDSPLVWKPGVCSGFRYMPAISYSFTISPPVRPSQDHRLGKSGVATEYGVYVGLAFQKEKEEQAPSCEALPGPSCPYDL